LTFPIREIENALHGYRSGRRMTQLPFLVGIVAAASFAALPAQGRIERPTTAACDSHVVRGVLPAWARAGFSDPKPRMPHVLSADGKLTAILWADPLLSPKPRDHNNKILWVSRVPTDPGSSLRISAQRMNGATAVGAAVKREVVGGPGPSIINLPTPGCWRFTLHWSGQTDQADLEYAANR
jgi:hypothetical protein